MLISVYLLVMLDIKKITDITTLIQKLYTTLVVVFHENVMYYIVSESSLQGESNKSELKTLIIL